MFSDLPGDLPAPTPTSGQAHPSASLGRLKQALALDAPSPLKRELLARSLLMNTRARPHRPADAGQGEAHP